MDEIKKKYVKRSGLMIDKDQILMLKRNLISDQKYILERGITLDKT